MNVFGCHMPGLRIAPIVGRWGHTLSSMIGTDDEPPSLPGAGQLLDVAAFAATCARRAVASGRFGWVARPAGLTKKEAWYFKEEKESQLMQGIFDPFDLKRIPEDYRSRIERQRILLSEAIDQFMEATEFNRKEKTNRNTRYVLKQTLALLGDGYVDEVSPVMLQRLAGEFKRGGKTKATVLSYFGIIKSLFNWLIDDLEALEGKNPVSRVKMPPKSEKVRDFLVRPEDVLKGSSG